MKENIFKFKHFSIRQSTSPLKVGTDAMLLGSCCHAKNVKRVLDVGTGTGVLALMMAQKFDGATIDAIDISESALIDCMFNFEQSDWSDRLIASKIPIEKYTSGNYDLIICNPPFYDNGLLSSREEVNIAKHTNKFSKSLFFAKVSSILNDSGSCWIIVPTTTVDSWIDSAKNNNCYLRQKIVCNSKPNYSQRTILEFSINQVDKISISQLLIRNNDNSYSEQYKNLTVDFHGKAL